MIIKLIEAVYGFLWGDLITIPLPGGGSLGLSLLVLLLIPTGIYFTVRSRCLPVRVLPDMIHAAAANTNHPAAVGLVQALGVFIDTIIICSCTAFIILLVPEEVTAGLAGMDLMQAAMNYHVGGFGVVFIAVILWLFSFSTFIGILFYARSNVAYLFGDNWFSQTAYKVLALIMLFIGGLAAYTFVWDLGDVGVGLMTVFNLAILFPLSGEALASLRDYENTYKKKGL